VIIESFFVLRRLAHRSSLSLVVPPPCRYGSKQCLETNIVRLHAELDAAPSATYDIPTAPPPPLPGAASASAFTSLLYVLRHYDQLQPCVKIMIGLLKGQLYNRMLSAGPTKTALISMKSNPFISWPPSFLTPAQVDAANMHYEVALNAAQAAIDAAKKQASPEQAVVVVVPRAAASVPVAAPAAGSSLAPSTTMPTPRPLRARKNT
jgi:hypothetical protein